MADEQPTHFGDGIRKKLLDYALAAAFGFITALGYSWYSLNDLKHQMQRLEEKERDRSQVEKDRVAEDLRRARETGEMVEKLKNAAAEIEKQQEQIDRKLR